MAAPHSFLANLRLRETSFLAPGDFIVVGSRYVVMISLRYRYFKKKSYLFRFVARRSAASIAALATKLLMLLRSISAARSTSSRSDCVKYTKIFLSSVCRDRRRDLGAAPFFMAAMVHRRNGEPNDGLGYSCWGLGLTHPTAIPPSTQSTFAVRSTR
jgi:hypothetical protein